MKITDLSLRRPVTISMIVAAAVLIGAFAVSQLPLDLFPSLSLPVAAVHTSWPGSSPLEVEQQVTQPIEQALQSLPGVSEIDSTSSQGVSQVVVQFNYGVNLSQEVNDMRSAVNRVQAKLPSDSTVPVVQQFNPTNKPIMTLTLSGRQSLSSISDVANNIVAPALEHLNGIGSITTTGGLTRQITVLVNPNRLRYYGLSIQQVVLALSSGNLSADAGQVQKGSLLIPLHMAGQASSPNQINNIPIQVGNTNITIGDIATVQNGFQTPTQIASVNGEPAVSFSVVQATGANTVQVSNEVHQAAKLLQPQLPSGYRLQILSDSAQTIRDTIHTVITHTILGFIFGIAVMLLLLRSVRTTVVIAVAIPIAVLTTFVLMFLSGLTLNSLTLGTLAVGLGSLVDFSIVVLESIFRARKRGLDAMEAARKGTSEVGQAVVVAALAQICVFAPSLFTPGIAGQFFTPVALTASFSHLAALFVALTFTPMLASRLLRGSQFEREESIPGKTAPFRVWAPFDWFGRGFHELTQAYVRLLRWGLRHRMTVIAVSAAMLVASLRLIPLIGFELTPAVYTNQITVDVTLAPGTDLATTAGVVRQIESLARAHMPDVQSEYAQIGSSAGPTSGATNSAALTVTIGAGAAQSLPQIAHDFTAIAESVPGAQIIVTPTSAASGPATGGVQVDIQGPDLTTLNILSQQVTHIMQQTTGLEYVDNTALKGTPDYQLTISQAALAQFGLTEQQVETTLRDAFQGVNASSYFQGNNQYAIVAQFPASYSQNIANLSQLTIPNNQGKQIPLQNVSSLSLSEEPPIITHVNGVRSVQINANVYGTSAGQVQRKLSARLKELRVPVGYSINFGQQGAFLSSAFADLGIAMVASVLLLYMVMASLFESFLTPFVIMFSLPPTFVGAALGLFLTHRSLNVDSLIGAIMVIGLVANNAIVLVDYTNQLRATGLPLVDALLTAGPVRLRPIVMSTSTTVLAMLPLVLGYGTGASTLTSMATVIAFGLVLSTLVTLLLVPAMYVSLDRQIARVKSLAARKHAQKPASPEM
ncbi:MAG: efflux RND transporter permease subunit [Bacilli bacterium]